MEEKVVDKVAHLNHVSVDNTSFNRFRTEKVVNFLFSFLQLFTNFFFK